MSFYSEDNHKVPSYIVILLYLKTCCSAAVTAVTAAALIVIDRYDRLEGEIKHR
jgi:hypothetical protein